MTLQVVAVQDKKDLKTFIRLPNQIYRNDPNWVAPLEFERKQFFNPQKNPFYRHGESELFLAFKEGVPAGRISAQIHHGHLDKYRDAAGFFGFFESMDDKNVAQALIDAAQVWLQKKGMKKMRGPFNFSMYDNEAGILIDGFEHRPAILMGYNPRYYPALLEGAGFKKIKDLYAYTYTVGAITPPVLELDKVTREHPGLTLRSVNMKKFDEDIRLMMQIFNEAWDKNWGFVPTTEEEIRYIAKSLKPIIDPEMAFFAHVNGDPAAFSISLPDIHEAIHDLRGKLFPLGWAKLLWRIKIKRLKSLRLCLMGIRKPYRGSAVGALSVLMNTEAHRRGQSRGYQKGELGWTLEDNEKINRGIEFMGGRRYKTYRIFEKEI
ncbi:MAG: hypothetical protein HY609_03015 [Deltaproteobacteria bacterium]|nr:hypothetical protein [Deltaproteobacteria bacterium]